MSTDPNRAGDADHRQRDWFRFGVVLAILWAVFTLVVVALLRVDTTLALGFAVVVATLGGAAPTLFVLFRGE